MNYAQFLLTLSESEYIQCIYHTPSDPSKNYLESIVIDWASIHYPNITITPLK
jgi:hypothetical protein